MRRSIGRERLANVLRDAGELVTNRRCGQFPRRVAPRGCQDPVAVVPAGLVQTREARPVRSHPARLPPSGAGAARTVDSGARAIRPWICRGLVCCGALGPDRADVSQRAGLHGERQQASRAASTRHDLCPEAGQAGPDIRHSARLVRHGESAGFRRTPDRGGHAGRAAHRGRHTACLRLPRSLRTVGTGRSPQANRVRGPLGQRRCLQANGVPPRAARGGRRDTGCLSLSTYGW